jgi:hypothetical protein
MGGFSTPELYQSEEISIWRGQWFSRNEQQIWGEGTFQIIKLRKCGCLVSKIYPERFSIIMLDLIKVCTKVWNKQANIGTLFLTYCNQITGGREKVRAPGI